MKIAVNLLPFRKELGGVGRYAKNILNELAILDKKNEYFLFMSQNSSLHFNVSSKNFKQIICDINSENFFSRIIFEQVKFPELLRNYKIDVLFTPSVAIPYFCKIKKITTIHDIAYKKIKKKYPFFRRNYISFITKIAMKKSDVILTVSEFSKKELANEFDIDPKEIIVIHNGVGKEYYEEYLNDNSKKLLAKYNLPEKYILYVGAIEPGKNLDLLLAAFDKVIKIHNISLVLTGGLGWKKDYIFSKISKKSIVNRIIVLPYIPDNELPIIYQNANLFVYISPYEGFGMPVLEAMASKVPVLASKNNAIKEFAKNSIFYLENNSVTFISSAISDLLRDDLQKEEKINASFKIAKEFSWQKSAKMLYEIINKV